MNQIDLACESFRKLLEEQLLRVSSMKSEKTDFSQKEVITIGTHGRPNSEHSHLIDI